MKIIVLTLCILSFSLNVIGQKADLKVILEDIEESKGTIYISLHSKEETFPDNSDDSVITITLTDFDSNAEYTFKNLDKGDYAISFFQDLNDNEELDTNFIGFPKEPVGASNMTSLARPKFSKCKFSLESDKTLNLQFMN